MKVIIIVVLAVLALISVQPAKAETDIMNEIRNLNVFKLQWVFYIDFKDISNFNLLYKHNILDIAQEALDLDQNWSILKISSHHSKT